MMKETKIAPNNRTAPRRRSHLDASEPIIFHVRCTAPDGRPRRFWLAPASVDGAGRGGLETALEEARAAGTDVVIEGRIGGQEGRIVYRKEVADGEQQATERADG